jgi:hypothetical protein
MPHMITLVQASSCRDNVCNIVEWATNTAAPKAKFATPTPRTSQYAALRQL